MPYYLHSHNTSPDTGTLYPDKHSAIAARTNGHTISYLSNDTDRETWTQRERRRLIDHAYTPLPWLDDDGVPQKRYRMVLNDPRGYGDLSPFADHDWTELARYVTVSRYHFAHVSLKSDAMIAYTPNDEHGHQDRQIRIRCGKYLDLVAPWLLPSEKDKLCTRVRSMASATFKLATTPADIRAVYRYGHGFSSCMDGRNFSADDDTNPVSAYGNSDLAVAYLGDLDAENPRITARVVVWPEKKLYTRIYGDELLACLLKQDAWQSTDWENDFPLTGAKIRAIRYNGSTRRYVMPYLDFATTVSLSNDRQHFLICDNDDPGGFTCRETDGQSGSREIECDHCGSNFTQSENGESECGDCRDGMWTCDNCSDSFYSDDESEQVQTHRSYRVNTYCERCVNRIAHTCERCDSHFFDCQFSSAEHIARGKADVADYCQSCADDVIEERTKAEDDTDTPSAVVPIRATDDTETLPLPLAPTSEVSNVPIFWRAIGESAAPAGTIWMADGDDRKYAWPPYIEWRESHFVTLDNTSCYERCPDPRVPIHDDRPWRDIPIGATVQVIEIPHHTGIKHDRDHMYWNQCGSFGHDLCHCSPSYGGSRISNTVIPADKLYRVLETAGQV